MTVNTRTRIAAARAAYRGVSLLRGPWRSDEVVARRRGLRWRLDLREGIDLSIYLFGAFEPSVARAYRRFLSPGSVALDIGANVGAHTLPLAAAVGAGGRVIAFEPTSWAFRKLEANLDLNPALSGRVRAEHALLIGTGESAPPVEAYASWPLVGRAGLHPEHLGRLMGTGGARAVTLDAYAAETGLDRLDFVKLDVDGAEPEVLAGGAQTMACHRPAMVMELAPYLYEEASGRFESLVGFLTTNRYRATHLRTGRPLALDAHRLRMAIPAGSSLNVLCLP